PPPSRAPPPHPPGVPPPLHQPPPPSPPPPLARAARAYLSTTSRSTGPLTGISKDPSFASATVCVSSSSPCSRVISMLDGSGPSLAFSFPLIATDPGSSSAAALLSGDASAATRSSCGSPGRPVQYLKNSERSRPAAFEPPAPTSDRHA